MADITTWTPITAPTEFRDDAVFDIDFRTKTVQVLVEQPIVAGENLSQFIKFQAPRYYDNIDLTNMSVNILYVSPAGNKGISAAINTEYSDDMIRCGWLVPYAACPEKGTLLFVLEFVGADYVLKTTIGSTPVLDSINDADVIPEPVEQVWYITLQANVSAALQEAQTALGRIESIFNALGTPMTAGAAAEMVDETAIYVYTGSETGYTYGNWYYYDGTEWVSGGAYASTALITDSTLSREGQAADAEAVGTALSEKTISGNADTGASVIGKESVELNGVTRTSGATGLNAVAEGIGTAARGNGCHAEGTGTIAKNPNAHAEGLGSQAIANAAHAEGTNTVVSSDYAHAEGAGTRATGYAAHAEGGGTTVSGEYAHAEGSGSTASANAAHAEGSGTQATANSAHAEGGGTQATAYAAHAEGGGCVASGAQAHAEGAGTAASGVNSHAEGITSNANGAGSHAEGYNTFAKNAYQHVGGMYNVQDPSAADSSQPGTYAEIIGNGTSDTQRSNARTLDWQGNEAIAGSLTIGMGTNDETTITPAQLKALLALLS